MQALGNATQSSGRGRLREGDGVRRSLWLRPRARTIQQCFNSQRPLGTATSGDCGITYSSSLTGRYTLDFGFQVNDRFVSASAAGSQGAKTVVSAVPSPSSNTGVNVTTLNFGTQNYSTDRFFIFVY